MDCSLLASFGSSKPKSNPRRLLRKPDCPKAFAVYIDEDMTIVWSVAAGSVESLITKDFLLNDLQSIAR